MKFVFLSESFNFETEKWFSLVKTIRVYLHPSNLNSFSNIKINTVSNVKVNLNFRNL